MNITCELYRDSFQNWKTKDIKKAQLILTDIPYQLGANAYGSNPMWYNDGDNSNGESKLAGKSFFDTDSKDGFRIAEFFHFCSNLLKKEPKEKGEAGCMILFCALEQHEELKKYAKEYGFNNSIPLIFYREKLPKFRNDGKMIFQCLPWIDDNRTPKIHPTQKPVPLLEFLISIFTDVGDVVIDCCAGSGTTLLASKNLGRHSYGFELKKEYVDGFYKKILPCHKRSLFADFDLDKYDNERMNRIKRYSKDSGLLEE